MNISYLSASICFICFPVLLLCGLQYCFLTAWGGLKAFLIHILVHSCKYYTELPMELRTKRKRKCKAAHFPLIMHYANVIRFFPFCRDLLLLLECRQQVTFLESSSRFVNFRWYKEMNIVLFAMQVHCLKITKNVTFWHFPLIFVWLINFKNSTKLTILNETFSVIFKHRVQGQYSILKCKNARNPFGSKYRIFNVQQMSHIYFVPYLLVLTLLDFWRENWYLVM